MTDKEKDDLYAELQRQATKIYELETHMIRLENLIKAGK
jgi:hypothetical protein